MAVAGGPDEDGLVVLVGLSDQRDRLGEAAAQVLFAVLLDDAVIAHAHVDEIECPPRSRPVEDFLQPGGPGIVNAGLRGYRDRLVGTASARGRDGEHDDVGTPGNAVGAAPAADERDAPPCRDDARDRRAVRRNDAGLVLRRAEEDFRHVRLVKGRMILVDPAVDQAHRLAGARFDVDSMFQFELRVGAARPDRRQPPLDVEAVPLAVPVFEALQPRFVSVRLQAALDGLNARGHDDRGLGRSIRLRPGTAAATAGRDECRHRQHRDDGSDRRSRSARRALHPCSFSACGALLPVPSERSACCMHKEH